jgi:hypothetical protein
VWDVVSQVGSGLTLIAFLAAAGVTIWRRYLLARERQLLATPENERGAVVQALNNAFLVPSSSIDPGTLSQKQRYALLLEQIRDRSRRFYVAAIVIVVIALIVAAVTIFAMSRAQLSTETHVPNLTENDSVPQPTRPIESPREPKTTTTVKSNTGRAPQDIPVFMIRRLTSEELQSRSVWELTLMRNEIYARHGRKFRRADLQSHFDAQTWYEPQYEPEDFPSSLLTPTQRYNVDLLAVAERQGGSR